MQDMMELLEEDLTCPICCSLFDDPRVLPCSHNFCKKCLEGILEGNVRNVLWRPSLFKCPTCRKETPVTGVNSLQVNYSLKGIVEKYNKIKRGGKDSWSSCLKIGASIMISTIRKDGVLFSYILDFLRTLQLSLPTNFSDYQRLQREADFYELNSLAEILSQENLLKPRLEILEVRFLLQETQAFIRIFGSCSSTIEELAGRISMFTEQQLGQGWHNNSFPPQRPLNPVPLERPSHHDLVFQCGTDYSVADQLVTRYVSIKPDARKLINGTNVLGLLVDTLLKEGFHLEMVCNQLKYQHDF
ncbi:potassium channel regulatory protein [Alligator mississippiensis]|uniref:Potassium channel regulatory protein n=1 Tax=Alligator mississippiensis TaxID=8496 RepID=A0A151NC45_ALLMI|nr:potassium channel regulatory protein [Alligator mississippiensis]